jgi:hypothetical protein
MFTPLLNRSAIGTTLDILFRGRSAEIFNRTNSATLRAKLNVSRMASSLLKARRELFQQNEIRPGPAARVVRAATPASDELALAWNRA